MYLEHENFKQPIDVDEKVWRYLDFTKFVALLESRSLFFTRADKLGDPFEGSYPVQNVSGRRQVPNDLPVERQGEFLNSVIGLSHALKHFPRYMAVNCWHLNSHESAAMWKIFLKSSEGVAIRSTYRKLRDCFRHNSEDIFIGQVKYIDYDKEYFDAGNMLEPFVNKRKSFEHEREVRALLARWPNSLANSGGNDFSTDTIGDGISIPVELNLLIESIYVSPEAPIWFADLVRAVIRQYEMQFEVVQSDLLKRPLY